MGNGTRRSAFDLWNYVPRRMRPTEIRPDDQAEFDGIMAHLARDRQRAALKAGCISRSFLAFNTGGTRRPLIWCFNNWAEPHLLVAQLSRDIPLYAFVSLHHYTPRWGLKTRFNDPLARILLEDIQALVLGPDLVLGGNCQGAPIMESVALQLDQHNGPLPDLITLDYTPRRAYRGPYTLLFGQNSRFNPLRDHPDPLSDWRLQGMQPRLRMIENATHGTYFRSPNIAPLTAQIEQVIGPAAPVQTASA